ncbi:hypothetical protein KR200_003963 [Drosophila serrata]|nr:hypothetical protein KR200_003963 [Drosophila serrata]
MTNSTTTHCIYPGKDCRILVGMVTGHCLVAAHAVRLGITNNGNCRKCDEPEAAETLDHLIYRLDFTYSDKRQIHVIEQEMGTLRQGSLTLLQYYNEVEKKLTFLTNKATMSYEASAARFMCEKFRDDALRIFISGLKRSLSNVLFSAKPKDMPTALALAQEVESNHERYTVATSCAKSLENRNRKQIPKAQDRQQTSYQGHPQSSYHQITLAERDREKTSFSVNGGKYEFRRLPFGLKNAGSIFQRTIDDILREQIGKFCYVYVDDVIVFSEDENAHIRHVD